MATIAKMATSLPSSRWLLAGVLIIGNLGGALLTFAYFRFVDPTINEGISTLGTAEIAYFVLGFGVLFVIVRALIARWMQPVTRRAASNPVPAELDPLARRRALMAPAAVAAFSFGGWVAAGFVWGVLWPLLSGGFDPWRALRQLFAIIFVAGSFVTAIVYFGCEHVWRAELPRFFPLGDLSAARVPRLRVRTRMMVVFLLLSLMPLAMLAVAALTRANALLGADADAAASIVRNLIIVVAVLAAGGMVASIGLSALVADSVAAPLRDVQRAMAQVRDGALEVRCPVVSNDEIGTVAEGFNAMVEGLRERERIRETFGKYVSPEVRDEILAGRASTEGALCDVTILFADLRDFTPWVESHPAAEVVADLNAYFGEMDAAIRAQGGLVLQFIGDEIEAVFGAPIPNALHADAAVAAARAMGARLEAFNAGRVAAGKAAMRHGIGIHSGTVIAGNIGSSERLSYTLVGDAVNVASRIQALNKEFGTTVLVSGATRALLASSADLAPLPAVKVKGRSSEVAIYALGAAPSDPRSPSMRST